MNCLRCACCHRPIVGEAWPLVSADGMPDVCQECFDKDASVSFWSAIDCMHEPFRELAHAVAWNAEQLGFTQAESEEIANAMLGIDDLDNMPERERFWIRELAKRIREKKQVASN